MVESHPAKQPWVRMFSWWSKWVLYGIIWIAGKLSIGRQNCCDFLFLNGPFPASFSLFSSFQYTVDSKQIFNKFCRRLDSNLQPLVLEATALQTEAQPLPVIFFAIESQAIEWYFCLSVTVWPKKSPNVYKSRLKMISLQKW